MAPSSFADPEALEQESADLPNNASRLEGMSLVPGGGGAND